MMEKMQMSLSEKLREELLKEYEKSMENEEFKKLVSLNKIPADIVMKNNTKLMDTCDELKNCKGCKGLHECKNNVSGHVLYPKYDGTLKFVYMPCRYQKLMKKKLQEKKDNLNEIDKARMKDIDINDKNRVKVIKWLKNFYDNYEVFNSMKGLYLHGSFGSGKTFLIASLFNELKINKNATTEVVYFPDLLRNMKEDFSMVEEKINYLENVDLLLIDDIGAENVTSWGRDEILGTILQYRMNNKLPTFFTSNLTIGELENNLAIAKNSEDKVKARRIIERIKQLTEDLELVSINRRK